MHLNIFKSQIPTVLCNLIVLCFSWDIVRCVRIYGPWLH